MPPRLQVYKYRHGMLQPAPRQSITRAGGCCSPRLLADQSALANCLYDIMSNNPAMEVSYDGSWLHADDATMCWRAKISGSGLYHTPSVVLYESDTGHGGAYSDIFTSSPE